jgi:hypothetical protein
LSSGFSVDHDDPNQVFLEFEESDDDVARAVIENRVHQLNTFGRLRFGRAFEPVSVAATRSVDADGNPRQVVHVGAAHGHLQPAEFAAFVEKLGFPRPDMPKGLEVIEALSHDDIATAAASTPDVQHVLDLVMEMLRGDEQIDWRAGYAAVEAVEYDLGQRGVDGQAEGWWTSAERDRFRHTANSRKALGIYSRHGDLHGDVPKKPMPATDASWYVRRVVAHWLTYLLSKQKT